MSQIMKAFMGIFMILFMMVTATGVVGIFFQVSHAQNWYAVVVDELENSDYAPAVIRECFDVSEELGYKLELILYPEKDPYVSIGGTDAVPENTDKITMARVSIEYPLEIAFFGIYMEQELRGYAR